MVRRAALLWVLLAVAAAAVASPPDDWRARQALLDSLANPKALPAGEAMCFGSRRVDAGTMHEQDAPRSYTFRWRNVGNKPLVITRIQTTCGCARPAFSREPVAVGESAEITVTYHPKGHPGSFLRKIFVYTQLSERQPTAILELAGVVESGGAMTGEYPCAMGGLRLKRGRVVIDSSRRGVERIECMNGGERTLNVSADRRLLPAWLEVSCEPASIAPGATADIVIRFDPARANARMLPERVPVLLDGVDVPPGQRTLTIELKRDK